MATWFNGNAESRGCPRNGKRSFALTRQQAGAATDQGKALKGYASDWEGEAQTMTASPDTGRFHVCVFWCEVPPESS